MQLTRLSVYPRCQIFKQNPPIGMSAMQSHDGRGGHIAPVGHESGLVAYECPVCHYVTSVLWQPNEDGWQ